MRLALLLERVPASDECSRLSLDDDAILSLMEVHDLVVAVDEDSVGLERLRAAGIAAHVSDKRHIHLPGGRRVDADEALWSWLGAAHQGSPFDLVIASSERPPRGLSRGELASVPWGVLVGSGPSAHARRLSVDQDWLEAHGHDLWLAASNVASADVVVSNVLPAALGLAVGDQPVRALIEPTVPMRAEEVSGRSVVVMATGVSRAEAGSLFEAIRRVVDVHDEATVVIIHGPDLPDALPIGPAVAAGIPARFNEQTVLVPADRWSAAGAWLATADGLVLADESELMIPEVARRATHVPTSFINPPAQEWRSTAVSAEPPSVAPPGRIGAVMWTRPSQVEAELRALLQSTDVDAVILHSAAAAGVASKLVHRSALARYDVVVAGKPAPPWGMPTSSELDGGVVCIQRGAWPALVSRLTEGQTLPALISSLADLSGALSHSLGVVAWCREPEVVVRPGRGGSPLELDHAPLRGFRVPAVAAVEAGTIYLRGGEPAESRPLAVDSARAWARRTRWSSRVEAALPWRLGLAQRIAAGAFPDEVVPWLKQRRFSDRVRLALPWKWGLLPRAMEGRW